MYEVFKNIRKILITINKNYIFNSNLASTAINSKQKLIKIDLEFKLSYVLY